MLRQRCQLAWYEISNPFWRASNSNRYNTNVVSPSRKICTARPSTARTASSEPTFGRLRTAACGRIFSRRSCQKPRLKRGDGCGLSGALFPGVWTVETGRREEAMNALHRKRRAARQPGNRCPPNLQDGVRSRSRKELMLPFSSVELFCLSRMFLVPQIGRLFAGRSRAC